MPKVTLFQMRNSKKGQSQESSVLLGCSGTGDVAHGMAKYLGIRLQASGMPWRGARPLHETMVITWLIDLLSFLRPSCFSAFYYSSLNLFSL